MGSLKVTKSYTIRVWAIHKIGGLMYPYPHCQLCDRFTDHRGEHDMEVELGLAEYCDQDVVFTKLGLLFKEENPASWAQLTEILFKIDILGHHLFLQG
jgi:hypothetical protein